MQDSLPYSGAFAIVPAHEMPGVPPRWQAVVVRKEHFGFAPCSSRASPADCLADIARLARKYSEAEFFRALRDYDHGRGARACAAFRKHVGKMLSGRRNVLEKEIEAALAGTKADRVPRAVLAGRFRPRATARAARESAFLLAF